MPSDQPDWVHARRRAIGARIRTARENAQFSQLRLGELCGVDHKTIHRVEYGASDPSLSLLLRIAHHVSVPLADLLSDDAPARPRRGT